MLDTSPKRRIIHVNHDHNMNIETRFKITETKENRNRCWDIINGSDLDNFCVITEQISQTALGLMVKKMNELVRGKGEAVIRAAILPNGNVSVDIV